jgi:hypothetical protein
LSSARNGRTGVPARLERGVASPGEESRIRRRCGKGDRGAAVLWPDQAMRGHVVRALGSPEEKADIMARTRGRALRAKEKKLWRTEGWLQHFRPRGLRARIACSHRVFVGWTCPPV